MTMIFEPLTDDSEEEEEDTLLTLFIGACFALPPETQLLKDLIESNPEEFQKYAPLLIRATISQSSNPLILLEIMLDAGANPNAMHEGRHPIVQAAKSGNVDLVKFFLSRGSDPEAMDRYNVQSITIGGMRGTNSGNNSLIRMDAEGIALSEGHTEMADLIHQAKHQKPSRNYNNIIELIESVHQKSDEKVLQRLQEELRHENNKCLGCRTPDDKTLAEVLCANSMPRSIQFLVSQNITIDINPDHIIAEVFSPKLSPEMIPIILDLCPTILSLTFQDSYWLEYLILKVKHFQKATLLMQSIENLAKRKSSEDFPVDMSTPMFMGGNCSIVYVACVSDNLETVRSVIHMLDVLNDTKKSKFTTKQVINFVHQWDLLHDHWPKVPKLALCLPLAMKSNKDALEMTNLLLKHGADPNLKFAARRKSSARTSVISFHVSEMKESSHNLELAQLLMDFGAKDEEQMTLFTAQSAGDEDMRDLILLNSWPAVPDNYNCHNCNNKTSIPKCEFVKELKEKLAVFGYEKSPLADNKVLFNRKSVADLFPDYTAAKCNDMKHHHQHKFILEPLQLAFTQLNIYKDIDHELAIKTVLHFFRQMKMAEMLTRHEIRHFAVLDLLTTIRIENCATFDTLDPVFFTGCHSLKHLMVIDNKKLEHLPRKVDISRCIIEFLQLEKNTLREVPKWVFSMPNLKALKLAENRLQTLPVEMWLARSLETLDLSHNQELKKLPESNLMSSSLSALNTSRIQRLSETSMDGSFNADSVDCCCVSEESLHNFKLKWKKLSFFEKKYTASKDVRLQPVIPVVDPENINGLQLQTLTLTNCGLTSLPKNLACLAPRLAYLSCKKNKIEKISIPEQFPPNIVRLDFENNNLHSIHYLCDSAFLCLRNNDSSLNQEESMDSHDRNGNAYKDQWVQRCRHTSHERLENLQNLDLSHNPNLKRVHFDYNMETKDRHIIASTRLPGLSNLFLNDCSLAEISDSITRLKSLRWLAVNNNPGITTIPEDLAQLEKLHNFNFDGCNISDDVLRGIADKGSATKEVIRYLSAQREGKEPWKRMKLMFMGESEAGKTSMVRAMARCAGSSSTDKYQGVMRYAVRQHMLPPEQVESERNEPPLSTVGVDIGDWVYPLDNNQPNMPQIWFDTWDFAGQEVFQITHQYFITRRCVFVLVFNLVKKQNGKYVTRPNEELFRELKKWLNNIYCRIPNAHFLLVGTRKDLARTAVSDDPGYFELLKQFLFDKLRRFDEQYGNKSSGFPIIEDILYVTLLNGREEQITTLSSSIWNVAANMKPESSGIDKNRNLIDIEVPQRYRVVENWFRQQKKEMKMRDEEPVLSGDVLEQRINAHLESKNRRKLDPHEFSIMMTFMHENGIILNYDSVFLSDKYFTDPQWLADQLAYVITIKESQDYGTSGIVRIDEFLNKMSKIQALKKLKTWPKIFIPLLAQFEVALKFNENYLLIPSSLPTEREHLDRYSKQWERDIQVQSIVQPDMPCCEAVQKFHSRFKNKKISRDETPENTRQNRRFSTYQVLNTSNFISDAASENQDDLEKVTLRMTLCEPSEMACLAKVMVFSYIPFGFWARLLARIIADEQFAVNAASILVPSSRSISPKLSYALNSGMAWRCWKTGLSLILWNHIPIIEVKEILSDENLRHSPFSQNMENVRVCKQNLINATGHMGRTLNAGDPSQFPARVEFCETRLNKAFPKQTLTIKIFKPEVMAYEEKQFHNYTLRESTYLHADNRTVAHFFEQISQHVDILLKEWYPNLGEDRFKKIGDHEHSIERVIPCPDCLKHDKPRILVKHLNLQFNVNDIIEHEQNKQKSNRKPQLGEWGPSTDISSTEDDSDEEKETRDRKAKNEGISKAGTGESKENNGKKKMVRASSIQPGHRRPLTTGAVEETFSTEDSKRLFKKIVRRYTTTIGGDNFDYSEHWHHYHGVASPPDKQEPFGTKLDMGYDAIPNDYDTETIYSTDERRSTLGSRFMHSYNRKPTAADFLSPKLHCFVEEEVLLLACSGETELACPKHGEFPISDVTPNFFFIDLPPDKVVPRKMFEIEKYLGYGCFGAVFSGFITDPLGRSDKKIKVANKFYQPIYLSENLKTPADSKAAIHSKQQHWLQEPVINIADAYMELRKEMSVLMQLVNPYIVTFYGASLSPIALLLDIAPMGSLEDRLQSFREENAVVQPAVMKEVTQQIALALAYLHQHAFVHRDLKPANVLVWKFPNPNQATKQIPKTGSTLVKLADYGMAQKEIGEGMLGRPGTIPYMAPEILSNEGKEIYSNKIDVYSLGMIVYDLVCMTPPWMIPNYLDIRNLVLDGKRPPITAAANQSPVAFLDLLCYCTLPDPRDRPSAQEVADILNMQLCCKLIETVQLKSKFMYGVSNMGLSLVPGEGGPKAMQTVVIHSLDQYQTLACESVDSNTPIRQKLDLSFLYYKDVLRETMTFQSDLGYYTDNEVVSCICPVNNNFLLGTTEGSLIVLLIQDGGNFQIKHKQRVSKKSIIKILNLEAKGGDFSCLATVSETAAITFFKFSDELFNNGKHSSPVKLATLESAPIEKIHSACLLINKHASNFRDPQGSLSFSSRGSTDTSSFASDSPSPTFNPLNIPEDLELWLSVQNSQVRRYIIKKSLARHSECGNFLWFEPTYPTLKFDPDNLFDGRLTAQQLVTIPEYERVWAAGSESRYLYMWDLEMLQLTTTTCPTQQLSDLDNEISGSVLSSPRSPTTDDRRLSTHVIQINDMKAFDGCIYVALSNGFVLVYHGGSGQQLNSFRSHSTTTFKILPLEPKANPPCTPIMQHYLQLMQQKDPRFLTFGSGTFDTVELEFEKQRRYTIMKHRKETMMPQEDRRYQTVKRPIIAKLWNTYGDVVEPRPPMTKKKSRERAPRLMKQQTLTNMTVDEMDAMLEYEESLRPIWLPEDEKHFISRWTEEEIAHFSSFVQFEDPAPHSLGTVTPSDEENENDELDDMPKRSQRIESMMNKFLGRKSQSMRGKRGSQSRDSKPSVFYTNPKAFSNASLPNMGSAQIRITKPLSVIKTDVGGSSTFQNCMVQVNSDGFACHKFKLTTCKYKIEFSNGVVVEWAARSIKNGCRSVFVLMTPPSETFVNKIQSCSTDPVHISPVVIILYEPRSLFLHPVTITFPLPKIGYNRFRDNFDMSHQLFTGLEIFPGFLFPVNKLEEKHILDRNYIHYGSDEIYGPVFVISKRQSYEINKLYLNQLLPKSQLILLAIYKENSIERKMSFSCLDLDQFLEVVKMLPLKQIQIHGLRKLTSVSNHRDIEINAFNRTVKLQTGDKEIRIVEEKNDIKRSNSDISASSLQNNEVIYRFKELVGKSSQFEHENLGKIELWLCPTVKDQVINSVMRSIVQSGKNWDQLLANFSFDTNEVSTFEKLDCQDVLYKAVTILSEIETKIFLTQLFREEMLKENLDPAQYIDDLYCDLSHVEAYTRCIEHFISKNMKTRTEIGQALSAVPKLKGLEFGFSISQHIAVQAAKLLVEKFRFNKLSGKTADLAVLVHNSLNVFKSVEEE